LFEVVPGLLEGFKVHKRQGRNLMQTWICRWHFYSRSGVHCNPGESTSAPISGPLRGCGTV